MVAKCAPIPFDVGTDITHVHRIARLLWNHGLSQGFVRRVFTRIEWPVLYQRLQHVEGGDRKANLRLLNSPLRALSGSNTFDIEVRHSSTPLSQLARFIAGRWAAKEAVIKAYSSRRLFMSEISVVQPAWSPQLFPSEQRNSLQTMALIDPPVNTILLDDTIARLRKLRGFDRTVVKNVVAKPEAKEYQERRSRIEDEHRRLGKVSISHDGDYAIATCIVPDEIPTELRYQRIVDDGKGAPIHEPEYGDAGWFDKKSTPTGIENF